MKIKQAKDILGQHFGDRYWVLEMTLKCNFWPENTKLVWRVWDSFRSCSIEGTTLSEVVDRVVNPGKIPDLDELEVESAELEPVSVSVQKVEVVA